MAATSRKGYIKPKDVSRSRAKKVLEFLNAAKTPEEIAEAVEISGERDIGLGVARNILAMRAELERFSDLQQVYNVPQVGPERFTEIVNTLSQGKEVGRMAERKRTQLAEFKDPIAAANAGIANNTVAIVGLGQALVAKGLLTGEDIQAGIQHYLKTLEFGGVDVCRPRTFIEPRVTATSEAFAAAGKGELAGISIDCNWGFGLGIAIVAIVGPLPGPT